MLQPFCKMRAVGLVAGQKIRCAEVHLGLSRAAGEDGANIFRIGQIDFAQRGRNVVAAGIERLSELAVEFNLSGAYELRLVAGDTVEDGKE